ncbi:MoaF N-terminal domain-containing protein [Streptomyces sp. AC602_WCS936]|uniref:MoaF-related domain-containing protein n=1 Tax=Streptomyces sp. AC602_WCS936 TaxID=2823685 RepID=UPI001C2542C1|nr:MoaF N-terminal domain-containing protein [Streptomyces sp. AC602_WCS936]
MRKRILTAAVLPVAAVALATAAPVASATPHSTAAPVASVATTHHTELPAFAGHAYYLRLDNGIVFRNSYSADGAKLHWEALEGPMKGQSGDEDITVTRVGDGVYHVNWIEDSGITVSHVFDTVHNTVSIFMTFETEQGRVGEAHTATLQRIL